MKKHIVAVAIVAAALAAAPSGAQTSAPCAPTGIGVGSSGPVTKLQPRAGKGVPSSTPVVRAPIGRGVTP